MKLKQQIINKLKEAESLLAMHEEGVFFGYRYRTV
jgi:hypothetical protein